MNILEASSFSRLELQPHLLISNIRMYNYFCFLQGGEGGVAYLMQLSVGGSLSATAVTIGVVYLMKLSSGGGGAWGA